MKRLFKNLEPVDIILVADKRAKATIPYLIMYDNKWNMICMVCGGIVGSFKSKGELYEAAKECVIDIIPRQIAINMANTQLGGRFGYPIVTHDNGAYVD